MIAKVFLDVDGVLSPMGEDSPGWADWEAMPYGTYSIELSRAMADRIQRLRAQLVWLTTWGPLANSEIGAWLEWPNLDVAELRDSSSSTESKVEALERSIPDANTPVVVIDDDEGVIAAAARLLDGRSHLLVQPDPAIGLTPLHLDEIEAFLSG